MATWEGARVYPGFNFLQHLLLISFLVSSWISHSRGSPRLALTCLGSISVSHVTSPHAPAGTTGTGSPEPCVDRQTDTAPGLF